MRESSQYVIDTHALVWYIGGSQRLPPTARAALQQVDQGQATGLIPILVLAEVIRLFEKRKVNTSFRDIVNIVNRNPNYVIIPLTLEQIEAASLLHFTNDLFDRIYVALAQLRGATIISKDTIIESCGLVPVIWA